MSKYIHLRARFLCTFQSLCVHARYTTQVLHGTYTIQACMEFFKPWEDKFKILNINVGLEKQRYYLHAFLL